MALVRSGMFGGRGRGDDFGEQDEAVLDNVHRDRLTLGDLEGINIWAVDYLAEEGV